MCESQVRVLLLRCPCVHDRVCIVPCTHSGAHSHRREDTHMKDLETQLTSSSRVTNPS